MVRVKICGITNEADALAAIDAGANLLGFNFYEKSPRFITEAEAARIRPQLPKKVEAVGIFVNASTAEITALRKSVKLNVAQLHGDETPEAVAEIAHILPGDQSLPSRARLFLEDPRRILRRICFSV